MIKILNTSLSPLCVLTKVKSIQWTKRFYDVGSFELHIPTTDENLQYIKENYFIKHNNNVGIILYLEQTNTDIKICGYDLKGILKKRKCLGEKTGHAETIIKEFIDENLINATDTNRNIDNFENATDQERGSVISWKSELSKLDVEINKLCVLNELGYDVTLENDIFTFDVFRGVDRTKTQSIIPPVLFCKQFKNISDFDYIKDNLTSYNTAYVGTTEIALTTYTGIERNEGIDTSTGTVDEVQSKGEQLLKTNGTKENISTETNERIRYNVDWFLGDYVTLKVDVFGETLLIDKQITEVLEIYERGNTKVKPTFGEVKDSIIKKLMKG